MDPVWNEIESTLHQLYSLPHNQIHLRERGLSIENEVKKKLEEIRTGSVGIPQKEAFIGPKVFLRVGGSANRIYSGEWWFDADQINHLDQNYSRIYFNSADRKMAIRNMLREILALSREWNTIHEVWALELPAGEKLIGFFSIVAPQKLFATVPLSEKGNRLLAGRARQIYFPVKNPLWVREYHQLAAP
jgi:hypothetical protein